MAVSLTINGAAYPFPQSGDSLWGDSVTNWAQAVSTGLLQKAGGTFTLTADINFGSSYGLIAKYFTSAVASPATAGVVRLSNVDSIAWLNAAGTGNNLLTVDSNNALNYNGAPVGQSGVSGGGTGITSYTSGDMLYATGATTLAKRAIGSTNTVLTSSGTAPVWAQIADANIAAGAAIAYSKLSLAGAVKLVSDVTGILPIGNGGTGSSTASNAFNALSPMTTLGDIIFGGASGAGTRLGVGTANQVLSVVSGSPAWTNPVSPGSFAYAGTYPSSSTNYWFVGSTTQADFTVNGTTPSPTSVFNSNFGTVSKESANRPGVNFSAPRTGIIEVTANATFVNGTASQNSLFLLESTTSTALASIAFILLANAGAQATLVGFFSATSGTTYNFKLQGATNGGSLQLGGLGSAGGGAQLDLTFKYIS